MALGKRKRSSYVARAKRSIRTGSRTRGIRMLQSKRYASMVRSSALSKRVSMLTSMIETKETVQITGTNVSLPHNNIHEVGINPFALNIGASEPMSGTGQRIGDKISCRGVLIKGFMENALNRSKVHYRIMLVRGAKGEVFNRANLYKGIVGNKIIDQMNTERFTIVASKKFTINCANGAASSVGATGVPAVDPLYNVGIGTKAWSMWVPGTKFGRNGNIQYENQSTSQVKFYDYRIVILAYDWYGTPQDVNNVGKINDMYCKLYFKDA